jgi:hypothetical protein
MTPMARESPSRCVRDVDPTMSVNMIVRNAVETQGSLGSGSWILPRNSSTLRPSIWMIEYPTHPCASRWTDSTASWDGPCAKQKTAPVAGSNQ